MISKIRGTAGFVFDFILSLCIYFIGLTFLWKLEEQFYPMVGVQPKKYILIFFVLDCLIIFLIHSKLYRFKSWYKPERMNLKLKTKRIITLLIILLAILPILLSFLI